MDLQLSCHAALVQGSSKGIGYGIAEALAREGCRVLLTGRSEGPLAEAAERLRSATGTAVAFQVSDTADVDAQERLVRRAVAEFGRLDIVVSNSGGPPPGGLLDLTPEQWRQAADLLLVSPVRLFQAALPHLEKSSAPRFFVVTSSSTRQPVPGLTLSNVYRPGVYGLIKTMAAEFGPRNICCHSLAPGRIDTDRLNTVLTRQAEAAGRSVEEQRTLTEQAIPLRRLGKPADLGNLAAFLSSPLANYLTGGNWLVDGGLIQSL